MPASADDRRVIVFATVLVAFAGLAVMALLFLATGGDDDGDPEQTAPLFLGLESELVDKIQEGGPLYFANPFGDNGFWLDLEDGELVALDLVKPGTADCQVKWRDPRQAYVDCDDNDLQNVDLDRYEVSVGKRAEDSPDDGVYVDLRVQEPAPGSSDTTG